jgi:hypothetical protein
LSSRSKPRRPARLPPRFPALPGFVRPGTAPPVRHHPRRGFNYDTAKIRKSELPPSAPLRPLGMDSVNRPSIGFVRPSDGESTSGQPPSAPAVIHAVEHLNDSKPRRPALPLAASLAALLYHSQQASPPCSTTRGKPRRPALPVAASAASTALHLRPPPNAPKSLAVRLTSRGAALAALYHRPSPTRRKSPTPQDFKGC